MKKGHQKICEAGAAAVMAVAVARESSSTNKGKLWEKDQDAGDMDELLAVLGYKVRSSDMEDVAQKMEQLEMVMGTAQEDGISLIASDIVHYNPSDLSSWVRSMLTGLNNSPTPDLDHVFLFFPIRIPNTNKLLAAIIPRFIMMILRAIPGVAAYPQPKRIKTLIPSAGNESSSSPLLFLLPALLYQNLL